MYARICAQLRGGRRRAVADLPGWRSSETRLKNGAVESEQRAWLKEPVVEMSEAGARRLGSVYWREVSHTTRGFVRGGPEDDVELRVIGRGPALLRFGPAEVSVEACGVSCTFPIVGGVLSRTPSGTLTFAQRRLDDRVLLVSAIAGFHPTLAGRPGAPAWTGELYKRVQARIHVAISGNYFRRLITEARQ
jgi:hypothetical protein